MTWVWWVLGAVVILVVLDRVAVWAESRGWIYWRRRSPEGGGGGVLGDVFELFAPSRQHLVEEKDRQRLTIAQRESEEPPFGIDLDAGTAVLPGDPPALEAATGGAGATRTPTRPPEPPG